MTSLDGINKIFFSGIGGISISAVAMILHERGYKVWGSDIAVNDITRRVEKCGITVFTEHRAENIRDAELLVYNARIREDNPERAAARERGIPSITRAEMIGYLMKDSPCPIGICGTHGKSTATAMAGQVFMSAGLDPTILIGAEYPPLGGTHRVGGGDHFIFEACEYTDSFLSFFPKIALILNVEMDHPDYFRDIKHMVDSFRRFADITGPDGSAVVNADSPHAMEAVQDYRGRIVRFSLKDTTCEILCRNLRYESGYGVFDVYACGELYANVKLCVPGEFNVANALGVCGAAWLCGIPGADAARGLSEFRLIGRRFEYKGSFGGVTVIDDYAHHPTAIRATLETARGMDFHEIWCVFHPHTYSRTADLLTEFSEALRLADHVILPDIYSATEKNTYGISSRDLADKIPGALYMPDFAQIEEYLRKNTRPGDVVMTMGAGMANLIGDKLVAAAD